MFDTRTRAEFTGEDMRKRSRGDHLPGANRPGIALLPLFCDSREAVRLERWAPGAAIALDLPGGAELLVIDGAFEEGGERCERQSWLRLPPGSSLQATAGPAGCTVWIKSGHLRLIEGVNRS